MNNTLKEVKKEFRGELYSLYGVFDTFDEREDAANHCRKLGYDVIELIFAKEEDHPNSVWIKERLNDEP